MTDSLDTSDREAEDPREPIRLPVREMRDEPVPHQAADPIRAALQLALEATPEELQGALSAVRAALAAQPAGGQVPQGWIDSLRLAMEHSAWDGVLQLSDALANIDDAAAMLAAAPEAPAQADHTDLLRMIAHRAKCFPGYPLGYHIPEVFAAIGEEPPQPAAQPTQAEAPSEREIRRMLCVAYAGASAYMDDGEAQDNRAHPSIDFLRDTPDVIRQKMMARAALASQPQAEAVLLGYLSPKQLPLIKDPDEMGGVYMPMRKTPAGNFTLAVYADPPTQASQPKAVDAEECDCRDTLLWALSTQFQIAPEDCGPEPTLRDILFSYYARSGMSSAEAKRCSDAFINKLFAAIDAARRAGGAA
ncbi:hypothetical protein [Hydrogenophaga sp. T2]|uniref:hypothetical protein n=1 Tax=Hydrogenophaga sp. T2 TaxID=3132823 RepID=UPI003CE95DAE